MYGEYTRTMGRSYPGVLRYEVSVTERMGRLPFQLYHPRANGQNMPIKTNPIDSAGAVASTSPPFQLFNFGCIDNAQKAIKKLGDVNLLTHGGSSRRVHREPDNYDVSVFPIGIYRVYSATPCLLWEISLSVKNWTSCRRTVARIHFSECAINLCHSQTI